MWLTVWSRWLCLATLLCSGLGSPLGAQNNVPSPTNASAYFPPEAFADFFAAFFSNYLIRVGEPSLLTASREPSFVSYRVESLAGRTERVVAVRLSLNLDGSARVFITEEFGTPTTVHKRENIVTAIASAKFLQLIEKGQFWSMPPVEQTIANSHRATYKMDASTWVLEGVRNRQYHVVLRRGPDPGPFTDMVHFLLKDLGKVR